MRVVIAPDSFGGTLSAPEAAAAIAAGWAEVAPADELRQVPLADGGTGFVGVLHAALGGEPRQLTVTGPLGFPVSAHWLRITDQSSDHQGLRRRVTGYLEAAQACGLHLVAAPGRGPDSARHATSRGVGELIAAVLGNGPAPGVDRLVVGLGGSACTDCGAGALAALGAAPLDADGAELPDGGAALAQVAALSSVPGLPAGAELVLAADVDNPLLGRRGAASVFGPQKGADPAAVAELDAALGRYLAVLAAAVGRDPMALAALPGAGAAGGLGAALLALGGQRVSGAGLVCGLTGLDAALDTCDLVLTGEGSFDWQSLRGKLVTAVAQGAAERGLPCVVLAGQVGVGRREAAAIGVEEAHSVAEHTCGVEAALADPAGTLAALAASVAIQWSGSR
ncbi:MAG: glycerate kinase [Actinomycetota bacterium]|nr:glycerate kinase [Actinomycetota bacterium]